jgi:3',5'-cyclic AMP phosphodiesterase CpdA
MPIYLPSFSRRKFLAGSVSAGVGFMAGGTLDAGILGLDAMGDGSDPDRLALLSDTHVSASLGRTHRGVNMCDNLRRVCDAVLAQRHAPAHVLINGDLAYLHGRSGDYETAVGLLAPLREAGLPVQIGLGNHDSREHLRAALAAAAGGAEPPADALVSADDRHVTLLELPRVNVLMLDSLRNTNRPRGALGQAQLDWLAAALDARPDKPAVVFMHHHPELGLNLIKAGLADTAALLAVLSPRRQAKALFFGHTHVWSHRQRPDGLHLVNLPATAYTFSFRQPSGWVDAAFHRNGATLRLHGLNPRHRKHDDQLPLRWRA